MDLFDFTSIYQAEYAARAVSRDDTDLLICLVGDSLVQVRHHVYVSENDYKNGEFSPSHF